jgi:hypothetical protein
VIGNLRSRIVTDVNVREDATGEWSATDDSSVVPQTGGPNTRIGQRHGGAGSVKMIVGGAILDSRGGELSPPGEKARERRLRSRSVRVGRDPEKNPHDRAAINGQPGRRRRSRSRRGNRRHSSWRRTKPLGGGRRRRAARTLRALPGSSQRRSRRLARGHKRAGNPGFRASAARPSGIARRALLLATLTFRALGKEGDNQPQTKAPKQRRKDKPLYHDQAGHQPRHQHSWT